MNGTRLCFRLGFDNTDSRWVGAWWLILLTESAILFMCGPIVAGFPKYMLSKFVHEVRKSRVAFLKHTLLNWNTTFMTHLVEWVVIVMLSV